MVLLRADVNVSVKGEKFGVHIGIKCQLIRFMEMAIES